MSHGKHEACQEFFLGILWYWVAFSAILMSSGTYSNAGPLADRAIVRRSVRVERAEQRERSRLESTEELGSSPGGIPVITSNNVLRPSVVRRLVRRGFTLEQIESLTRGPQPIPGRERQSITETPQQLGQRGTAGMPIATEMQTTKPIIAKEPAGVQQTTDSHNSKTKSILVGGEEAIASQSVTGLSFPESADTGPAFPGLARQDHVKEETPVVTHEPIELLPTPKPKE